MRNIIVWPVFITGLFIISCNNSHTPEPEKSIEVPVVSVQCKNLELDQSYVSKIQAVRNVELRSKVSGFLEAIYVDEGQPVKKGQLLFKIGDNEYRAEVDRTRAVVNSVKADARTAELECERIKQMVDKQIVSKTELELAISKLNAAKAKTEEAESSLQNALHRLSYTSICAPFDGIVDRIPLKTGSLLSESALITTVSGIDEMYAYFNISESEYLAYKKETARDTVSERRVVSLILADGQDYDYKGKIEIVVGEFDETTGSISFRARFPNPKHLLKHNATGKVKLVINMEKALIVPQKAAFEIQDKTYVYVLDAANTVKMKSFLPSGRTGPYYIIKSGLNAGDRIVYEGIQNMREGMKIVPRNVMTDSLPQIASF